MREPTSTVLYADDLALIITHDMHSLNMFQAKYQDNLTKQIEIIIS